MVNTMSSDADVGDDSPPVTEEKSPKRQSVNFQEGCDIIRDSHGQKNDEITEKQEMSTQN